MPTAPQQLDIFDDSHDLMLRNDVASALQARDRVGARAAWLRLQEAFPDDAALAGLGGLLGALERVDDSALPDHTTFAGERRRLEAELAPMARETLGRGGEAWMRPAWSALAARATALPFSPEHSDDHAAFAWLQAGDWGAAEAAVSTIASWRRIPVPLAWMLLARYRLRGLDGEAATSDGGVWPLLAELGWLAPARLAAVLDQLADPLLGRLLKRFGAEFDGDGGLADLPWFAAWVLTQTPALAGRLARAWPSQHRAPERGLRAVVELLALERQGRQRDAVDKRRALRDLSPPLFAAFMATR